MPYIRKYPVGYVAYNVSSMRENQQEDIFLPCDSRLVAVNVGADGACGDLVCDTNQNNAFDPMRSAWLQSVFRVLKAPLGSFNAVGFQLNDSGRKDTKGGYFIDKGDGGTATQILDYDPTGNQISTIRGTNTPLPRGIIIGQGSYLDGGPFHVGNKSDKHRHGNDADGNPINALHWWTGALFYRNQVEDGPLRFEAIPYKTGQDQAVIVPVHLTWAGNDWAWWSTSFVYRPGDHPPPYYPPDLPLPPDDPFDPWSPGHGEDPDDPGGGEYPGGGSGGGALENPNDPGVVGPGGLNRDDGETGTTPVGLLQPAAGITPFSFMGSEGTPSFLSDSGGGSAFNNVMGISSLDGPPMDVLATTNPLSSTGGAFQAANYASGASSDGMFSSGTAASAGKTADSSPMIGGFSSFAAQGGTIAAGTSPSGAPFPAGTTGAQGDPWIYKASPKNQLMPGVRKSKWKSGTANGGIVYHPAETDLRDAQSNGMAPSNISLNTFMVMTAPNAYFGCGVPELVNGGIKAGYRWGVDSTTGDVVWSSISSSQTPQEAFRLTNTSQRIQWNAGQPYYGQQTHSNTANRVYTFEDITSNVGAVLKGTGAPGMSAPEGVFYWATDTDVLYVNNNGSTGWTAVGGGASGNEVLVGSNEFLADSTSYTFSSLDGDVDILYVLEWYLIKTGTSAHKVYLELNADSGTNYTEALRYSLSNGSGSAAISPGTNAYLLADNGGGAGAGDGTASGRVYIWAESGRYRVLKGSRSEWQPQGTGLVVDADSTTVWKNSADNLTSLKIESSVASEIKSGSWLRLWKRTL